jgi:hypothetical protein
VPSFFRLQESADAWANAQASGRRRGRWLHLERTNVDASVHDAIITETALIVERRRREARVARINGGAASQQLVGKCRAAIVLERTEHWVGVDLVPGRSQKTAAIIAAEVIAVRRDRA